MKATLQISGVPNAAKMRSSFNRVLFGLAKEATEANRAETLNALKAPSTVKYPIQWVSEKQRRFVMAKLRRENNLPYRRTGALEAGWLYAAVPTPEGGTIILENVTKYGKYVYGSFRGRGEQAPFHRNSGWNVAFDVRQKAFQDVTAYIEPRFVEALFAFGKFTTSRV